MANYKTIQLPTEFVEKWIDPVVEDKSAGFQSRAEFVKEACRRLNEKYTSKNKIEIKNDSGI